jgi:hypothetical protein
VSRRVQLVIVCEDNQQEAFLRRTLEGLGWERRGMRVEKAPGGHGSGEQFVRERYPRELKVHRSRPVSQALVVMMDGDSQGVMARLNQLNDACEEAGIPKRASRERVAVFVPTWNIETWLAYLRGEQVDEARSNYPRLPRERDCQEQVDELVRMCHAGELRQPSPTSLDAACNEYNMRLAGEPR